MASNQKQIGLATHNQDGAEDRFVFAIKDGTSNTAFGLTTAEEAVLVGLLLPAVQTVREAAFRADDDGGAGVLMDDGSVRPDDGGQFLFGDGSVRFAVDPGVDPQGIEVHTALHEVVNDALF